MLAAATISTLLNLLVLAGLPFLLYFAYQKRRHKRGIGEIAQRAGLRFGEGSYVGYSLVFALVGVAMLVIWPPPYAGVISMDLPIGQRWLARKDLV